MNNNNNNNKEELLRNKLFEALSKNNDYSLDEFNKEFNNVEEVDIQSFKFPVKIVNNSNNKTPKYESNGAAGFDFRANIIEPLEIPGSQSGKNIVMVPTGLHFELPINFELQVRPRSGLAAKHGITVLNSPGTVDSDYRGEVKVILINHKLESFTINPGDRIAQGVISNISNNNTIKFEEVENLSNTERGSGGFGSTGIK